MAPTAPLDNQKYSRLLCGPFPLQDMIEVKPGVSTTKSVNSMPLGTLSSISNP